MQTGNELQKHYNLRHNPSLDLKAVVFIVEGQSHGPLVITEASAQKTTSEMRIAGRFQASDDNGGQVINLGQYQSELGGLLLGFLPSEGRHETRKVAGAVPSTGYV